MMQEIQEIKDQIYKDSILLNSLFNNISFNLYECAENEYDKEAIRSVRRIIQQQMVRNMVKIYETPTEDQVAVVQEGEQPKAIEDKSDL
jgi:hypothetical protein